MIGIYKITSPSGRVYIGQSRDIEHRKSRYLNLDPSIKGQTRIWASICKYGIEAHIIETVEECLFEDLNVRERYWQDFYDVLSEKGLNCVLTDTNEKPKQYSEEIKKKMSQCQMGNTKWKGRHHTEKSKQLLRDKATGRLHTEEAKEKIRKKKTGMKYPNRKKNKEYPHFKSRKVIDLNTGKIYNSIRKAAQDLNIVYSVLVARLAGDLQNITTIRYYEDLVKTN